MILSYLKATSAGGGFFMAPRVVFPEKNAILKIGTCKI
jgi:hypothetical protein